MGGARRDTVRARLCGIGVAVLLAACDSHDDSARSMSTTDGGVAETGGTSQGGASGAGGSVISVGGAAGSTDADAG